jgi:hypothetical protein
MKKSELISIIQQERAALNAVLDKLTPEDMTVSGVVGDWSVKDVLAHLAMWCTRTVTAIFQAERGQKPSLGVTNDWANNWANVNAQDYASQKDRPLDRILVDFHGSHAQLIKRLEAWKDEAALFDKQRYPSLGGESLADLAHGNGDEHDVEHRVQIEAWLAKRH